jgi:hypothetical protein
MMHAINNILNIYIILYTYLTIIMRDIFQLFIIGMNVDFLALLVWTLCASAGRSIGLGPTKVLYTYYIALMKNCHCSETQLTRNDILIFNATIRVRVRLWAKVICVQ